MELSKLLENAQVRSALVVDDAFDAVPLASDLSIDRDEWVQFFEDLLEDDLAAIKTLFPAYEQIRGEALPESDEFVTVLWNNRATLRTELLDPLFARYDSDRAQDLAYLDDLLNKLRAFGLTCETAGRDFQTKARAADLIVIDLFLGSAQNDDAVSRSVLGLVEVVRARPLRPPLVVLMSRSSRLEEKREEFRNKSGLFESAFRIIRKAELGEPGKLQRLVARLGGHYPESKRLAAFLNAWELGLRSAGERTLGLIRTLDLPDLAQIRQLLLSAEGEPTGSYLVDVFDRVLQHEIEREAQIIDAARELNGVTSETFPPPYIAGSPDLQDLVHRSLFQNRERLRLHGAVGSRVAFGDLLMRKAESADAGDPAPGSQLPEYGPNDVGVVLTPACDLQRKGAKRVLVLRGALKPLRAADWTYAEDPVRTPVIRMQDGGRFWIKWNLKEIETISHTVLETFLDAANGLTVAARLRESHALELQQKLLSNLGRVGLLAPMPGTFPLRVEAYLPDAHKILRPLRIPTLEQTGGICFVGRDGSKSSDRLVLCEDACEAIGEAIAKADLKGVHPNAHPAVNYLRESGDMLSVLELGVDLPSSVSNSFRTLYAPIMTPPDQGSGDGAKGVVAPQRAIGLLGRNLDMQERALSGGEVAKAGVVLITRDPALESTVTEPGDSA